MANRFTTAADVHRRDSLYNHPSMQARRAVERGQVPRDPIAELRSKHVDQKRDLGERHRRESAEQIERHRRQRMPKERLNINDPAMTTTQARQRHNLEKRQAGERQALADRHQAELLNALPKHG
jgi:hypothetical protein